MYYDSEEVCGSAPLQSVGGEPSGRADRSYRAGGTTNRLPLGRSSSILVHLYNILDFFGGTEIRGNFIKFRIFFNKF
ncbi:MAG: hypothetical protein ACFFD2_22355 [Promethearchaeota archaeon]